MPSTLSSFFSRKPRTSQGSSVTPSQSSGTPSPISATQPQEPRLSNSLTLAGQPDHSLHSRRSSSVESKGRRALPDSESPPGSAEPSRTRSATSASSGSSASQGDAGTPQSKSRRVKKNMNLAQITPKAERDEHYLALNQQCVRDLHDVMNLLLMANRPAPVDDPQRARKEAELVKALADSNAGLKMRRDGEQSERAATHLGVAYSLLLSVIPRLPGQHKSEPERAAYLKRFQEIVTVACRDRDEDDLRALQAVLEKLLGGDTTKALKLRELLGTLKRCIDKKLGPKLATRYDVSTPLHDIEPKGLVLLSHLARVRERVIDEQYEDGGLNLYVQGLYQKWLAEVAGVLHYETKARQQEIAFDFLAELANNDEGHRESVKLLLACLCATELTAVMTSPKTGLVCDDARKRLREMAQSARLDNPIRQLGQFAIKVQRGAGQLGDEGLNPVVRKSIIKHMAADMHEAAMCAEYLKALHKNDTAAKEAVVAAARKIKDSFSRVADLGISSLDSDGQAQWYRDVATLQFQYASSSSSSWASGGAAVQDAGADAAYERWLAAVDPKPAANRSRFAGPQAQPD